VLAQTINLRDSASSHRSVLARVHSGALNDSLQSESGIAFAPKLDIFHSHRCIQRSKRGRFTAAAAGCSTVDVVAHTTVIVVVAGNLAGYISASLLCHEICNLLALLDTRWNHALLAMSSIRTSR